MEDRQAGMQIGGQVNRQSQTDRQQTDRQQTDRKTSRHTDRHRQAGKKTDRWADIPTLHSLP